jgi:hypothetical protein
MPIRRSRLFGAWDKRATQQAVQQYVQQLQNGGMPAHYDPGQDVDFYDELDRIIPEPPLQETFRNANQSTELFTRANGINEFDLAFDGSNYYLFVHDYEVRSVQVRKAASIAGLATAPEVNTGIAGVYPTVVQDGNTWHMWVWDTAATPDVTKRYTAAAGDSTNWAFQEDVNLANVADWHVRKRMDGTWIASGRAPGFNNRMRILTAPAASGPWTDHGAVFDNPAHWHSKEEADPAVFEHSGRMYCLFAGYDDIESRSAIVEIDPSSYRALGPAMVLVEPLLPWQQRGNSFKVANPVFLDDGQNLPRIYFNHYPSASNINTGWAYLEAAPPLLLPKLRPKTLFYCEPRLGIERALNMRFKRGGNATTTINRDGFGFTRGPDSGSICGWLAGGIVNDFELEVVFASTNPALGSGTFQLLARVGRVNAGITDPAVAIWIDPTGRLLASIHNESSTDNLDITGSTVLAANTRYTARLRKVGNHAQLSLNERVEAAGTHASTVGGLREYSLGNMIGQAGASSTPHQLAGTIFSARMVAL